ncbi:MAG: SPOR domain-containing protein [Thermodesulfobacteriota bacterium]
MGKKIIGSIGILIGLGLATFFVYQVLFPQGNHRISASDPAATQQGAVPPTSEASQESASTPADSTAAPEPVTLPAPEAATAPEGAPGSEAAPAAQAAPASADPLVLAARAPAAGAPVAESAPRPPEPEIAPLSPLEPTEKQGLLAGRYRGFASAKKRMEKIKEQDLPAFVRPKGRFYEVWAGPFATPEEADQARKSLKAVKISAKKGKLIIPVPK